MKWTTSAFLLTMIACSSGEPRTVTGEGEADNWRNTYPNAKDTSFYHHEAFFSNGSLFHDVDYLNGKPNGLYQEWDSTGRLIRFGSYVNGERHGVWSIYNDGLLAQRSYIHGELVGPSFEQLKDGRVAYGQYTDGKETGLWVWTRGNSIDQTAIYSKGSYDGKMTGYWPNGAKEIEVTYKSDSLVGEVAYWDSLGRTSEKKNVGFRFDP